MPATRSQTRASDSFVNIASDPPPRKRRRLNRRIPSPHSSSSDEEPHQSPAPCEWFNEAQIHADEGNDKPIWRLRDFAFFEPKPISPRLVGLDAIFDASSNIQELEGSGFALPVRLDEDEWEDDGEDDDDDDQEEEPEQSAEDPIPLRLGAIFNYDIDLGTKAAGDLPWQQTTDNIWVQTQHAWYILEMPRADYCKEYLKFYKPRRLAQLIVQAALDNRNWDLPTFANSLAQYGKDKILRRTWNKQDLHSQLAAIGDILEAELNDDGDWRSSLRRMLLSSPLINSLTQLTAPAPPRKDTVDSNILVTPIVHLYARPWFRLPWTVIGDASNNARSPDVESESSSVSRPPSPTATEIQEADIELDDPCVHDDDTEQPRYLRMAWNGIEYRAHDTVKIRGGSTGNSKTMEYEWWFGRIVYFFEDTETKDASRRHAFHIEWYDCASAVLGPLGCSQELFAIESCTDLCVDTIVGPPILLAQPDYPLVSSPAGLFCTYLFSRASFVLLSRCAGRNIVGFCFVCSLRAQKAQERETESPRRNRNADTCCIRGVLYHLGDFVFLRRQAPEDEDSRPLDGGVSPIAQVIRFGSNGKTSVVMLRRTGPSSSFGERELSFAKKQKVVPNQDIVQRCRVLQTRPTDAALVQDPWVFFLADGTGSPNGTSTCTICEEDYERERNVITEFDEYHIGHPLRMLDPYSGAGGLTLGLERGSRCVRTRYAVDIEESAAKTFAANNPDAIVFNADANDFLSASYKGSRMKHLGGSISPGKDIDIISAGVPCQGHSGLNMFRKAEHQSNNQMLTALSLVECHRPRYFILENVPAIANWRLMAHQRRVGQIEGGVEHGGLRLAIAVLLALGYQARVGLLQAGHHGTPQSRRRFFLIAANAKSSLPEFPRPTTAFVSKRTLNPPARAFGVKKGAWQDGEDEPNVDQETNLPMCVPHHFVSVQCALGDLHEYDWDPVRSFKRENGTSVFCCTSPEGCIPSFSRPYATKPQNQYQLRARLTEPKSFSRLQHVTAGYPRTIVENVSSLGRDWNADYRSMGKLRTRDFMTGDPLSSTGRRGFAPGIYYRRLNPDGVFSTLVTNIHPTAKQSQVILPTQSRLISVREMARGQGFPDTYTFKGTLREMQKQLGNAVPVSLAEAIGRELRASMLKDWIEQRTSAPHD